MKEYYQMSKEEVLTQLDATEQGHSREKAEALLKEHGENVLKEGKRKSTLQVF